MPKRKISDLSNEEWVNIVKAFLENEKYKKYNRYTRKTIFLCNNLVTTNMNATLIKVEVKAFGKINMKTTT